MPLTRRELSSRPTEFISTMFGCRNLWTWIRSIKTITTLSRCSSVLGMQKSTGFGRTTPLRLR